MNQHYNPHISSSRRSSRQSLESDRSTHSVATSEVSNPSSPCLIGTDNEVAPPFELSMGLPPNPAAWRNRSHSAASSAGEIEPPTSASMGGRVSYRDETVPRIRYDGANTMFVKTC